MMEINKSLLKKFIHKAGEKLQGDWVLLGGSLIPFLGEFIRTTHDIDLAGFGTTEQSQTLKLLELSEDLGLPIEAINQAATFFLHKIPKWKEDLVVIHKGASATIYRPNASLYIILKLSRLSNSDLEDCLAMLKIAKNLEEKIDANRLLKAIKKHPNKDNLELSNRLTKLAATIAAAS